MQILDRDEKGMPAAVHNLMKIPLMNEREAVCKVVMKEVEDDKYLVIIHSYERDDHPIRDDRIRINMFRGMLFWQVEEGVRSIQLQQVNFKGYFPMRLMNMAVGNALRKQMRDVMMPKLKKMEAEAKG